MITSWLLGNVLDNNANSKSPVIMINGQAKTIFVAINDDSDFVDNSSCDFFFSVTENKFSARGFNWIRSRHIVYNSSSSSSRSYENSSKCSYARREPLCSLASGEKKLAKLVMRPSSRDKLTGRHKNVSRSSFCTQCKSTNMACNQFLPCLMLLVYYNIARKKI